MSFREFPHRSLKSPLLEVCQVEGPHLPRPLHHPSSPNPEAEENWGRSAANKTSCHKLKGGFPNRVVKEKENGKHRRFPGNPLSGVWVQVSWGWVAGSPGRGVRLLCSQGGWCSRPGKPVSGDLWVWLSVFPKYVAWENGHGPTSHLLPGP